MYFQTSFTFSHQNINKYVVVLVSLHFESRCNHSTKNAASKTYLKNLISCLTIVIC